MYTKIDRATELDRRLNRQKRVNRRRQVESLELAAFRAERREVVGR